MNSLNLSLYDPIMACINQVHVECSHGQHSRSPGICRWANGRVLRHWRRQQLDPRTSERKRGNPWSPQFSLEATSHWIIGWSIFKWASFRKPHCCIEIIWETASVATPEMWKYRQSKSRHGIHGMVLKDEPQDAWFLTKHNFVLQVDRITHWAAQKVGRSTWFVMFINRCILWLMTLGVYFEIAKSQIVKKETHKNDDSDCSSTIFYEDDIFHYISIHNLILSYITIKHILYKYTISPSLKKPSGRSLFFRRTRLVSEASPWRSVKSDIKRLNKNLQLSVLIYDIYHMHV